MKKNRSKSKKIGISSRKTVSSKTTVLNGDEKNEVLDLDDEETGFSAWLKSGEGVEWMKLFVIGNSLVVFLTMTWPQLQKIFKTLTEMIYGEEEETY